MDSANVRSGGPLDCREQFEPDELDMVREEIWMVSCHIVNIGTFFIFLFFYFDECPYRA